MVKKIVNEVIAEITKRLKKEMSNIDAKLDDIGRRITNIEAYVELQDIRRDFDFLISKHDSAAVADILNPIDTLQQEHGRRPGL